MRNVKRVECFFVSTSFVPPALLCFAFEESYCFAFESYCVAFVSDTLKYKGNSSCIVLCYIRFGHIEVQWQQLVYCSAVDSYCFTFISPASHSIFDGACWVDLSTRATARGLFRYRYGTYRVVLCHIYFFCFAFDCAGRIND